jgi:hypothetical protein
MGRMTSRSSRGRYLLYAIAFPGAVALDLVTPLGVADWLIELILVWVASLGGDAREVAVVAGIGSATMIAGLWSAPATVVPFWMGALNRLVAIGAMWTMVHVTRRRVTAEEAQRHSAAQIKILQGLLPICAACKAIRNNVGEWQRLENYLAANSEVQLTHTLCPVCAQKAFDEVAAYKPNT